MKVDITLKEAGEAFLEHLAEKGKKTGTIQVYRQDLKQIQAFFGAECNLASLKAPQVGKFYKSDWLLKLPNGNARSPHSIKKTVRVFRMMMLWLHECGLITTLPLPKQEPG